MLTRLRSLAKPTKCFCTIHGRRAIGTEVPFGDDLSGSSKDEVLEYDPNLAGFFEEGDGLAQQTSGPPAGDEYDFSEIQILDNSASSPRVLASTPLQATGYAASSLVGQTFSTPQATNILSVLDNEGPIEVDDELHNSTISHSVGKLDLAGFERFIKSFQLSNLVTESQSTQPKKQIYTSGLFESQKPTVFVSRTHDPFLNLALEMFIYDKMPPTAKRLVLYTNSPCIVIGKNQNAFKEINLRVSGALGIPVLRRFSGGGTVVHDFGNVNFSYMAGKSSFDRVGFTSALVETMNGLTTAPAVEINGKKFEMPKFQLKTTAKGDIVGEFDDKKVSGSAFKLSRGKFLHHGTMLLDSNLDVLRQLLKVSELQRSRVVSKGTDSISSSVANLECSREMFMWLCAQSFSAYCGNGRAFDWKNVNLVHIDDCASLPQEILRYHDTLRDWSHTFGGGPRWTHELVLDSGDKITFDIDNKGQVVSVETGTHKELFSPLEHALKSGEKIRYTGSKIKDYVRDAELGDWLAWNIDYALDYRRLGCHT